MIAVALSALPNTDVFVTAAVSMACAFSALKNSVIGAAVVLLMRTATWPGQRANAPKTSDSQRLCIAGVRIVVALSNCVAANTPRAVDPQRSAKVPGKCAKPDTIAPITDETALRVGVPIVLAPRVRANTSILFIAAAACVVALSKREVNLLIDAAAIVLAANKRDVRRPILAEPIIVAASA
jgi:hypothetical protein